MGRAWSVGTEGNETGRSARPSAYMPLHLVAHVF